MLSDRMAAVHRANSMLRPAHGNCRHAFKSVINIPSRYIAISNVREQLRPNFPTVLFSPADTVAHGSYAAPLSAARTRVDSQSGQLPPNPSGHPGTRRSNATIHLSPAFANATRTGGPCVISVAVEINLITLRGDRRLGLRRDASFEEVIGAKNFLYEVRWPARVHALASRF